MVAGGGTGRTPTNNAATPIGFADPVEVVSTRS
jgi:hypothetical protein